MWGVEGTAPLERLADGGMGELARRVVLANDMVGVVGVISPATWVHESGRPHSWQASDGAWPYLKASLPV